MKKTIILILASVIILQGCGSNKVESTPTISEEKELTTEEKNDSLIPSKDKVLTVRKQCLEGMTDEEISDLTSWIAAQNLSLEQEYVYDGKFEKYEDPDALIWNLYDETGEEVLIGYAYDPDEKEATYPEMDETEYGEKYGEPVVTSNEYNADAYIEKLQVLQETIDNEDFSADFQKLIGYYNEIKESHSVEALRNIYYIYHDMDYYLLRYAPEDFSEDMIADKSTIETYYGVLDVMK